MSLRREQTHGSGNLEHPTSALDRTSKRGPATASLFQKRWRDALRFARDLFECPSCQTCNNRAGRVTVGMCCISNDRPSLSFSKRSPRLCRIAPKPPGLIHSPEASWHLFLASVTDLFLTAPHFHESQSVPNLVWSRRVQCAPVS